MNSKGWKRVGLIVLVCAVAGALAGIAGSAAAPSSSKSSADAAAAAKARHFGLRMRAFKRFGPALAFGPGGEIGGPPVHAQVVVPNANGDGFDTVTMDSGKLKSIDGSNLTVTEGTDKATYDTPTIDVGSDAKVFRNHEKASLSDLKEGDFVHIVKGPKGTVVLAESPDFRAQEKKEMPRFFRHWRGGPPPGGPPPGGPPPGYPGDYPESGSSQGGSNS
jgi:hypothetical protein